MQEKSVNELRALYSKVRAIRGGITEVSIRANVQRGWVWMVFTGKGKSAHVIRTAKALITEREKSQTN